MEPYLETTFGQQGSEIIPGKTVKIFLVVKRYPNLYAWLPLYLHEGVRDLTSRIRSSRERVETRDPAQQELRPPIPRHLHLHENS